MAALALQAEVDPGADQGSRTIDVIGQCFQPTAHGLHALHGWTQATVEKVTEPLVTLDALFTQFARALVDQCEIGT